MKKIISPLVLLFLLPCLSFAQFLNTYSDPDGGDCSFSAVTTWGNFFVAIGNQDNKLLVVALDSEGNIIYRNLITIIDESETPVCYEALTDTDGMIAMVGFRGTLGSVSTYNAFVLRYNISTNSVLWVRQWQDIPADYGALFTEITELPGSDSYQVSGSFSQPLHSQEGIIANINKFNGALHIVSLLNYGNSADDFSSFLRSGNKIYTFGRNNLADGGFDKMRPCLSVLNNSGGEISTSAYVRNGSTDNARLYGIDLTLLNNNLYALVTGDNAGIAVNKDLYLLKIKKSGSLIFTKKLDFASDNDGRFQSITTYGSDLIVYGNKYDALGSNLEGDAFLMHLSSAGNPVWVKSYPFTFHQVGGGPGAMLVSGNNIWAVGRVFNATSNHYDGVVLQVNATSGDLASCDVDEPISVITETSVSNPIDMTDDITTNKLVKSTRSTATAATESKRICFNAFAEKLPSLNETAGNDLTIYPNPVSNSTVITYTMETDSHVTIDLFDLSGRKIKNMVNENTNAGSYAFNFNADQLSSGIYILKMKIDNGSVISRKIIID